MAAEQCSVELVQHHTTQLPCSWNAQAGAVAALTVEEPVTQDEGAARVGHWCAGDSRNQACRLGPRRGILGYDWFRVVDFLHDSDEVCPCP